MSTDTVAEARLGDKILTAVAVLIALFYVISAAKNPSIIEIIQAGLSLLFLPFMWVWRSRPVLSATGFIVLLAAWAVAWMSGLNDRMCCFAACRAKRHFVLVGV